MKVAAGIVLFNPDIPRFEECLSRILEQIDLVILFDNVGNQKKYENMNDKIVYMTENQNKGIAYALNKIMYEAKSRGYDWVVTMDQDTILPSNYIAEISHYENIPNVAIFSPQVIDKRRLYMSVEKEDNLKDIDYCITSASFTNLKIWEELGGFDEWLFIDYVDNDYCKRAKLKNYKILQIPNIVIDQEFGNITPKSPKMVKFYLWLSKITKNKNIAKLSYKKESNPFRVYYTHRNVVYLNKKFKRYGGIGYPNFHFKTFLGFLFYFTLPSFLRAKNKITILKSIFKGLYEGIQSNPQIL